MVLRRIRFRSGFQTRFETKDYGDRLTVSSIYLENRVRVHILLSESSKFVIHGFPTMPYIVRPDAFNIVLIRDNYLKYTCRE